MRTPPSLHGGSDFSLLHFEFEFQEAFRLDLATVLQLRRELRRAARLALDDPAGERFDALFNPPLAEEPTALRRHQKPAPAFACLPDPACFGEFDVGDRTEICFSFWGTGIRLLPDFCLVLQALGRSGLHRGEGRCELSAIVAEDVSGNRNRLWRGGRDHLRLAPPVNSLEWWLGQRDDAAPILLEFLTPARLLSRGRPLFRPSFRELFPFILRRVTSMHHAWCGSDLLDDPQPVLAAARQVEQLENSLRWQDWRTLQGADHEQELGGVFGSILLGGEALPDIFWVLHAGSLLNVGKGAAFGAGRYRLRLP